jgi:hypothetical protein
MPLNDFRSVHLPYCIKKLESGEYVVLNREYKPLGFKTRDQVDYEAYPIAVNFARLTPATAAKLSHNGKDDTNQIFLYDDGCIPTDSAAYMRQYLDRLAILAKLKFATTRPRRRF